MKDILIQLGIGATPYKIIKLLENKEYVKIMLKLLLVLDIVLFLTIFEYN